jgi:phosphatidylserine/phosphatidylglycerophosphate/cardiolipin synthase-like enzyme
MNPSNNPLKHRVLILLALALFNSSCSPSTFTHPTPTSLAPESGLIQDRLEIYFTDPAATRAMDYKGGPDEFLSAAIDKARLSVDMAAYSLNLWSLRDALLQAHQRGVVVRMVMESDNMDTEEVQAIIAAGIPVLGDQREGLMHDKYVVIDQVEVWTGSMNFTATGAYRDNNNLLRLRSIEAARRYSSEFSEMFDENRFGQDRRAADLNSFFLIESSGIQLLFSPEDGVAARIQALLKDARESIYFMAYSFTANDLGATLLQRFEDGLTVAGVMDDDQIISNQGSEYGSFKQAGVDVRRDGNAGQMHHKVIILDRTIVITGSYNFSASAEQHNDENVVIINDPGVASQYLAEFQRVYDQANP